MPVIQLLPSYRNVLAVGQGKETDQDGLLWAGKHGAGGVGWVHAGKQVGEWAGYVTDISLADIAKPEGWGYDPYDESRVVVGGVTRWNYTRKLRSLPVRCLL